MILADDRTGALETAAAVGDLLDESILVTTHARALASRGEGTTRRRVTVVDLATRHSPTHIAANRASAHDGAHALFHKMDSTLRGNWAAEVVARMRSSGRSAIVVPALPHLARICVDGVVTVDGVAVADGPAASDPLNPVLSSRPAEILRCAGLLDVTSIATPDQLMRWLHEREPAHSRPCAAVCDAATNEDVETLARTWATTSDTLFVGPASAVAAAVALQSGHNDRPATLGSSARRSAHLALTTGRVLIVCGSLHPNARAQVAQLIATDQRSGAHRSRRILAISTAPADAPPTSSQAEGAAQQLADETHRLLEREQVDALIVIGGDTVAAVLGESDVSVMCSLAPGTALGDWSGIRLVSRSGGFGDPSDLVRLVGLVHA
jgi:D-threonate/D-erythronate kinase